MRLTQRLTLLCALALLALAALATGASASTQPATGAFIEGHEHLLDERQVGDHWWYTIERNVRFTGTYSGQADFTELVIIEPDGTTHLYGSMAFSGKACGMKTELTFLIVGHGNQATTIEGSYTVLGASSAKLGEGTFTGTPGTAGLYTGVANWRLEEALRSLGADARRGPRRGIRGARARDGVVRGARRRRGGHADRQSDAFVFGYSKLDVMFGRRDAEDGAAPVPRLRQARCALRARDGSPRSIPTARRVTTDAGIHEADVLVVALGADYDFDGDARALPGRERVLLGRGRRAAARRAADVHRGRAIVGVCGAPFKCPPAPSEAALLLHDYL